ncbi:hypothetical protein M9H77_07194 [Catharanthus roseus]|uniref:Uncharacterized protein n=1 Tax=Catharanthus roseus TaxID=4058 RepID=A0ACC0BUH0_CATRO|nr:hypothetical protein M9H77_07194 [Catharanthus roseus]
MVVRSRDVNKYPFRPREEDEELLGPEVPYLSAIGALMYLANNTSPDIAFVVNLLARFSSSPTRQYWRYLGLFYSNNTSAKLIGFAATSYLYDPHKARPQTCYVFTKCGTAISWRSSKQSMVATSSNHFEIIAIHEQVENVRS